MKAIIEKEYIVDKVVGDINCGDKVLQDCIDRQNDTYNKVSIHSYFPQYTEV